MVKLGRVRPDFEFRQIDACKHIFAVKMFIAANVYLKEEPKPKVFASDYFEMARKDLQVFFSMLQELLRDFLYSISLIFA